MPALPYPDPPLTDGTIVLRPRRPEDAPPVAAFCNDESITRWVPLPSPYGEEDFHEWDRLSEHERAEGRGLSLLIAGADDRPVGSIGFKHLDRPGYTEIGYLLGKEARGRGYASRALRMARDWATRTLGVERIELLIHYENEASQRVARAAGFAETGEYRPCETGCTPDVADHKVFAWPGAEEA